MKCQENYIKYINNCKVGKSNAKGKRVSVIDFVRDAIWAQNEIEKDSINVQWNNNAEQNSPLKNLIPMIDTSASMEMDNNGPLYSAIGLGLRIAEKSKIGKRALTFSASPSWINLEDCTNFVSMVNKVRDAPWGANTNFRAALDLILDTAIIQNISPKDMKNMVLVILSDMQIDMAVPNNTNNTNNTNDTMFEMMKQKYHDAGLRTIHKEPYELPHIVFWNLRSTTGFPSLSTTVNTTMMSGNNPVLLNTFCKKGIESLKDCTPWNMLTQELTNERYNYLDQIATNLWQY